MILLLSFRPCNYREFIFVNIIRLSNRQHMLSISHAGTRYINGKLCIGALVQSIRN